MDKFFDKFLKTGKVDDYINYVNHYFKTVNEDDLKVTNDAVEHQGLDNTGTNYRGE